MLPKPSRGLIVSTPEEAKSMSDMVTTTEARVGDAVEVKGLSGNPAKQGQIVEVLGAGEHIHFRVRWDEDVAAGDGALRTHTTWRPRSSTKSSTRSPAALTAWARIPGGAGTTARTLSSGR